MPIARRFRSRRCRQAARISIIHHVGLHRPKRLSRILKASFSGDGNLAMCQGHKCVVEPDQNGTCLRNCSAKCLTGCLDSLRYNVEGRLKRGREERSCSRRQVQSEDSCSRHTISIGVQRWNLTCTIPVFTHDIVAGK
jgi:hypothetical protein